MLMRDNPSSAVELVVIPSIRARRDGDGLHLTRKYVEGMQAYAERWPGPVTSLVRLTEAASHDMDPVLYRDGVDLAAVEVLPDATDAVSARLAQAAAVLLFLSRAEQATADLCRKLGVPVIFISEYSPRTEVQIQAAEVSNPLLRARRRVWLWRSERIRRGMLSRASGLQCSGTPTYRHYRGLVPDALLFFDNRVRADDVADDALLARKAAVVRGGQPLRLVFGGRLAAMKGVMDLIPVAQRLREAGVPFELDIVGDGPLRSTVQDAIRAADLDRQVRLHGPLDFATGWIPFLRREADLFLCCHPQGDPSSTYPEVMSCGVPIVGYGNEAFEGIVDQSRAGWAVPMRDVQALAREVARLHGARAEIAAHARRARDFAAEHALEATYARRTEHILRNSRHPSARLG
jgi:glycosyltransferase involved in cell wall biosynthesis